LATGVLFLQIYFGIPIDFANRVGIYTAGGHMSLQKEFIRDGKRRIIGSVTSGYVGSFETVVRDEQNNITGSTSDRFNTTRDEHDRLISINSADPGLLIGKHNKK
jgi:YD repeat-containing protein